MTSFATTDAVRDVPTGGVDDAIRATPASDGISTLELVEMLLKDQGRLNHLLRDANCQRELVPRLMGVAMLGFVVYGLVATALFNAFWIDSGYWASQLPAAYWNDFSAANLVLAYTLGLIAANGICLPSFYFYGLLAGVRISMLGVTAHALKGMAAGAVALVGLLPIYVTMSLTALIFPVDTYWTSACVLFGLALPLVAGLSGAVNLYDGFVGLADTMTCQNRDERQCFLRRLILAWVGCATFVTPVVIYTLFDALGDFTQSLGGPV
jgi:hypothetical protein